MSVTASDSFALDLYSTIVFWRKFLVSSFAFEGEIKVSFINVGNHKVGKWTIAEKLQTYDIFIHNGKYDDNNFQYENDDQANSILRKTK